MAKSHPIIGIYHILFIYSSINGYFSCFPLLSTVTNAINICVQVFVKIPIFNSFRSIPRSSTVGSYHDSTCNVLSNLQTVFHSGYTILHSKFEFLRPKKLTLCPKGVLLASQRTQLFQQGLFLLWACLPPRADTWGICYFNIPISSWGQTSAVAGNNGVKIGFGIYLIT